MQKVIHFGLPADDPKRAMEFYKKVFGLATVTWEGPNNYRVIAVGYDDKKSKSAIVPHIRPKDTVNVESVDDAVRKIKEAGGTVTVPMQTIPGIGYIAYCTDIEGNLFGVLQPDTSAK